VNGIHNINPAVPAVNVAIDINRYFASPPWSSVGYVRAFVSPGSVGFFYLLPVELLLSFWFFYVLAKVQDVALSALAFPPLSNPHGMCSGYLNYQTAGAYFVLVIYLGAVALPHLKAVLRRAVTDAGPRGEDELIPYRAAVWGLLLSLAVVAIWFHWAGMALGFAVFVLLVYVFVQAIIMARGCAEGGLPMSEGSFTPLDIGMLAVRPSALGARTLTANAFFDALFARDLRGLLLTAFLDGQKLGDDVRARRRHLLLIFMLAIIVAIPIAAMIQLWLPYRQGALGLYSFPYRANGIQFFRENGAFLQGETRHTYGAIGSFAAGGAIAFALSIMRVRYVGWPFHPLGYALSASWTTTVFWFPMLIAWLVKSAIVHYGGMRFYTKVRPLFLGMIFGEFTSAVFWTLAAALGDVRAPFFPWP
jgi:hypothetical protein